MSFPSLNSTSDYDVYTTKYLQNLALQIQLNQTNFNKNVAYMKTGVQETERTDSRSIEERSGDVEKLKVQARVMLNKITDATNTNEVLNYLAKNGEILFFFIQQFPAIEKVVKEQYAGGVRAPILISLIYKRFISQQEDSLMPESADFDIVSNLMTRQDAEILLSQTLNQDLIDKLINLANVLPSQEEIKKLVDDPVGNKDEIKFVAEMFKNSPNVKDYNKLTEEYNDAPLKDERTNYDLEQAEDMMIELITSFLVERKAFQDNTYNQKRMEQIDKTILKITTKPLPVAKDTRIARTSEQDRVQKQTKRYIREGQYALYPTTTKVSEAPFREKYVEETRRKKLNKEISEPQFLYSTSRKSNTQDDMFSNDFLKSNKIDKEVLESVNKFKNIKKQPTREQDNREKLYIGTADTKASERQQEAKQREDREIQRIMNEMEEKRQKRQDEKEKKEEKLDKIKAFQEKLARRKISTFVIKQTERNKKEINQLEDDLVEIEKLEDNDLKQESLKAKREEIAVKKKPGRPVGSKDKNQRERTSKTQMSLARRLEALQQPIYPETPTEIEEKSLASRLEALQQPTIPIAPTTTPKKKIKVVQTGKGLLNKHEQLTHRFKVLKGEILAGNTASQVIKEMKLLVKQLVKSGELSLEQHDGILKELKTL